MEIDEKNFISSDKSKVQDYFVHDAVDKYLGNILGKKFKEYRKRWNKASRIEKLYDFPLFLVFEPLWKCNLKCIMCLHSDPKNTLLEYDGRMPWDMYVNIISESKKHNCPSLTIGGHCEPLLDTRIVEMIALAKESGFVDIMLNTNATLLNEAISKKLIESGLTRLRVGFDGATADTYEKIRVGSNFEIVKSNIMNFVKLRNKLNTKIPIVRISCVHLSKNDHEINDFINFWTPLADYVTALPRYFYRNDLVVCAGGTTLYELCAIGKPCIAIASNGSESKVIEKFRKKKLILAGLDKWDERLFLKELKRCIDSLPEIRRKG